MDDCRVEKLPELIGQAWTSVGLPIIVALLTTIVVEAFAKPRLEARKARLIRDRQQLDELIYAFQKVSLLGSSLLSQPQMTSRFKDIVSSQLDDFVASIDALLSCLSRLSPKYVGKHKTHIGRTASFMGYLKGLAVSARQSEGSELEGLRSAVGYLERFDVYFLVHLDFKDSQEKLIKRLFWKNFSAKDYEVDAEMALAKCGLRPKPSATPTSNI